MKAILITVYCLMISTILAAQPGTLDYGFGDSGKVISRNFGNCYSVALQQDGKIVCGGTIVDTSFRVVRYLPDGNLDSSFGKQGVADFRVNETYSIVDKLLLQPDQKIIIGGWGYKYGIPTLIVVRCLSDGSLDTSFGTNGIVDTSFGNGESIPAMGLQPDGKILMCGWYAPSSYITVRYNTDGSLDKNFGNGGTVFTDFGAFVLPSCITIQPDNKIVIGGSTSQPANFLIVRYMPDGTLDNSFGNKGKVVTNFGPGDEVLNAVALQTDGKIVVTGVTNYSNLDNMALARYEINGNLDTTFGLGGKVTCKFGELYSQATSLIVQIDGKIVISGSVYDYDGNFNYFGMARYLPNGTEDSAFGNMSQVLTDMGLYQTCNSSALQNDGKIILAGTSFTSDPITQLNFAVARYNNDESKKQIIVTKIRHWIQHHNGFTWDANSGISSYMVQRSYDGIHFSPIAKINAGNTSNYTYADPSPLNGTNYYRLQTTSTSNAVANSNVIAISNDDIKVSPNPSTSSLHIEGLSSSQKIKITVVDFNGNVAMSQQLLDNSSSYNLNIAALHAGSYILKIETNGEVITKQFVKE